MEPLTHASVISNDALLTFQRFKEVCDSASTWTGQHDSDPTAEDVQYAWTRFKVWTDNIGALQPSKSRSSLDYRIRHSDVHSEVRRLLGQLLSALEDLLAIFNNVREQQIWPRDIASSEKGSFISSSDSTNTTGSESDPSDSGTEDTEATQTESGQLHSIITDTISSLLGLSLVIQKSSRGSKFARSSREGEYSVQHDSLYIQDRFPHVRSNQRLVERLARANGRRRQWLSYRKRHRDKLAAGSGDVLEAQAGAGAALATAASEAWNNHLPEVSTLAPSLAPPSLLSATTATSLRDTGLASLEEDSRSAASETTSYLGSEYSTHEDGHLCTPSAPPEVETGMPFECPYCCAMVAMKSLRAWRKHVHADLASYQCTFENCSHELFESRNEWFAHEMTLHRQEWHCSLCSTYYHDSASFSAHCSEWHAQQFNPAQLPALVERSARPVSRISTRECPLCEFSSTVRDHGPQPTVPLSIFKRHLGQHLEQLALFVLPREATAQAPEDEDIAPADDNSEEGIALSGGSQATMSNDDDVSETMLDTDDDEEAALNDTNAVPDLALGWLPPHNFTPPTHYFADEDPDMIPRREDALFGGDVFTPGWVRGHGQKKEGFCGRCVPGIWLNIADKSYERNLTYMHGIPCNGIPIARPSAIRQRADGAPRWEAYCDKCEAWRILKRTSVGWNWFRHYLKEHSDTGDIGAHVPPAAMLQLKQTDLFHHIRAQDYAGCVQLLELEPRVLTLQTPEGKNAVHVTADVGDQAIMHAIIQRLQNDEHARSLGGPATLINALTSRGETPLTLAASQGHAEMVKILVESGADVNLSGFDSPTALDNAAEAGYTTIIKQLLEAGAETAKSLVYLRLNAARKRSKQLERTRSNTSGTSAWIAAGGDVGAPPQVVKGRMLSPLHIAASIGNVVLVTSLIDGGSDVEELSGEGETALMIAALRGHVKVADVLLSAGADIHATTSKGWTALMLATKARQERMVEVLLVHGADVNHLSPDHWTALAEASHQQQVGVLKRLLDCGADTESRSSHDWTPLMHAAYNGDEEAVRHLLDAGAALEITSLHDETALLLAIAGGHTEIVETLLEAGCRAEPSWVHQAEGTSRHAEQPETVLGGRDTQVGWTPVMLACQTGNLTILRRLLEMGASTLPTSAMGKTALEIANENGFSEIADVLRVRQQNA